LHPCTASILHITTTMSDDAIMYDIVNYFKQYTEFVPHERGNASLYGLNSWGTDSTIMFKGESDVWRFCYYVNSPSDDVNGARDLAKYVSRSGQSRTIPREYNEYITRMQPVV